MSTFPYKLPISLNTIQYPITPSSGNSSGTHYSIYGIGGYVEVQNLSELSYTSSTIPVNVLIDSSGNTTGLILNGDNISSGRRRLGMLAYVYETDTIYQFYIPNYDTAFNTATGTSAYQKRYTTFGTYETYVFPSSATTLLISGWTGDTIEGVSGATSATASWRKLSFSGGSSSGGTGTSGISGLIGISGDSGISGISGLDGSLGTSGISGISGVSGYSGSDGASGISGLSGISGMSGITSSEIAPNLVTVSLPGGVADFNSVKLAVDSITAATATSPYVVYVHPGTYYENSFSLKS